MEIRILEHAVVLLLWLTQQEFGSAQAPTQLFQCQSSSEQNVQVFTPNIPDMYFNQTSTAASPTRLGITALRVTYVFTIPPISAERDCGGPVLSLEFCYGYKGQFGRTVSNAFQFLVLSKQGREATINESFSISTTPSESICSSANASQNIGRVCCDDVTTNLLQLQHEAFVFGIIVNEETKLLTFHGTVPEFQFEQYQVSSQVTVPGDIIALDETSKLTAPLLFLRFFIVPASLGPTTVNSPTAAGTPPITSPAASTTMEAITTAPTEGDITTTDSTATFPTTTSSSNDPASTSPTSSTATTMDPTIMTSAATEARTTVASTTPSITDHTDVVSITTADSTTTGAASPSVTTVCVSANTISNKGNSGNCSCIATSAATDGLIGALTVSIVLNVVLIITSLFLLLLLTRARKKTVTVEDTSKDFTSVSQDQQEPLAMHTISNPSYGTSQDYEIPIRTVQQYGLNGFNHEYANI